MGHINNTANKVPGSVKKYVYRPSQDSDGNFVKVALQLKNLGFKASLYGVKGFQSLSDGAISITFENEDGHSRFNEELKAKKANIDWGMPAANPYEFRIHRLDPGLLPSTISSEIERRTGIEPIEVRIYQYSDQRYKGTNFSIIRCGRVLFDRVRNLSSISIGWEKYRVDTAPLPLKCKSCGLLGHTRKKCQIETVPVEIREKLHVPTVQADPTQKLECPDCVLQNHLNKNNNRYVVRATDHSRLSEGCKTFLVQRRRRFRNFSDISLQSEAETGLASATSNANKKDNTNALELSEHEGNSGRQFEQSVSTQRTPPQNNLLNNGVKQ